MLTQSSTATLKLIFAFKLLWCTGSAAIRLSLLLYLHRLMKVVGLHRYRWVLYWNIAFVAAVWLAFIFTTVFANIPVKAYWTFPPIPSKQPPEDVVFTVLSALNSLSELFVALLPTTLVLFKLDMPRSQKVWVSFLLSLGSLVGIVGFVRSYYAWLLFSGYDHPWWSTPYAITSSVELNTALVSRAFRIRHQTRAS